MSHRRNKEDALQMQIVKHLLWVLPPTVAATLHSIPNEHNCSQARGDKLNKMGRAKGAADLHFDHAGRSHYIECKLRTDPLYGTTKTYQTPEQKAWQAAVEAEGARYAVVRHSDELAPLLVEWGVPTRLSARCAPAEVR